MKGIGGNHRGENEGFLLITLAAPYHLDGPRLLVVAAVLARFLGLPFATDAWLFIALLGA